MARPCADLSVTQLTQGATASAFMQRDAEFLMQPGHQVNQPPAHRAMDRGDRSAFHDRRQSAALAIGELGGIARCLTVDQTVRTIAVETQRRVAHGLKADAADPRRVRARAAVINPGQNKKTPPCAAIFVAVAN